MIFDNPSCARTPDLMDTDEERALKVCEACPDLTRCQAWALALDAELDPAGVCGGLTEEQRTEIRGRRHPKTCTWCLVTKTRADFHRDPLGHHGVKAYCKECSRQRSADNRAKTRQRARERADA